MEKTVSKRPYCMPLVKYKGKSPLVKYKRKFTLVK